MMGKSQAALSRPKLNSLQVFRGVAALAVLLHHAVLSTEAFVGLLPAGLATALNFGYLGVDFFFVLSGFIIMHAHIGDVRTLPAVRRYAYKRLTRIYPAYLPVGLGLLAIYWVMPSLSAGGGREISLLTSLLLLPADGTPALSVAWTLVHELLFYAVFLLFFVSGRCLAGFLMLWALLILLANMVAAPTGWLRYPLSIMNIEFMFGVAGAWLYSTQTLRGRGAALAIVGMVFSCLALWLMVMDSALPALRLLLALGLAFLIVGFATLEHTISFRWPAFLLFLGNASYSIYLIHNPALSITQRVAAKVGLAWPAAMVFGVAISLLAGCVYYIMIERPVLRRLQTNVSAK